MPPDPPRAQCREFLGGRGDRTDRRPGVALGAEQAESGVTDPLGGREILGPERTVQGWLGVAILSGPITYGVVAAIGALDYFPPGQAAYYGMNPIFVASVAGQCAAAGLAEVWWRWRSGLRGRVVGRPLTWRIVAVVGGGVLHGDLPGGVPFFYVYQRGYLLLFT